MNKSRYDLFGISEKIKLETSIQVPDLYKNGISKCRVMYGATIENITFGFYTPRKIQSLKLIEDNSVSYSYKFTDRKQIELLFDRRGGSDEILIVKNGLISDTSFSNILFFDGNRWVTPITPLLKGTMRSMLLATNIIVEKRISSADLTTFTTARLINAMLPFEAEIDIPVSSIGL